MSFMMNLSFISARNVCPRWIGVWCKYDQYRLREGFDIRARYMA
jgi:hypothetical protein